MRTHTCLIPDTLIRHRSIRSHDSSGVCCRKYRSYVSRCSHNNNNSSSGQQVLSETHIVPYQGQAQGNRPRPGFCCRAYNGQRKPAEYNTRNGAAAGAVVCRPGVVKLIYWSAQLWIPLYTVYAFDIHRTAPVKPYRQGWCILEIALTPVLEMTQIRANAYSQFQKLLWTNR